MVVSSIMSPSDILDSGFSKYLSQVVRIPLLSAERERCLAERFEKEADLNAAKELVVSHLRLVVKVAFKFKRYGLPMSDIVSEGNIGLMKAVKKFKVEMNCRLSTYAIWWIKASIQSYILKTWSIVKVGTATLKKKLFCGLKKSELCLLKCENERDTGNRNDPSPSPSVVCDMLEYDGNQEVNAWSSGVFDQHISFFGEGGDDIKSGSSNEENECGYTTDTGHANQIGYTMSLLDDKMGYGCGVVDVIDNIDNGDFTDPENTVIERQSESLRMGALKDALCSLGERERDIVKLRHLTNKPHTLKYCAQKYNISEERVRQVENKALEKLKIILTNNKTTLQLYSG